MRTATFKDSLHEEKWAKPGFKVDADLKLDNQIRTILKSSFYYLSKPAKQIMCFEAVIHVFITTHWIRIM